MSESISSVWQHAQHLAGTCPRSHSRHQPQPRLPPGPMPNRLTAEAYLFRGHLGMSFSFQQFRVSGPSTLFRFALYIQATNCRLRCPEITLLFRPASSQPPAHQAQNSHIHHGSKTVCRIFLPFDNSSALSKCWHNEGHGAWCSHSKAQAFYAVIQRCHLICKDLSHPSLYQGLVAEQMTTHLVNGETKRLLTGLQSWSYITFPRGFTFC